MNKSLLLPSVIALAIFGAPGCTRKYPDHPGWSTPASTGVQVDEMLRQLQVAIDKIDGQSGRGQLPEFQKAVVTVATEKTTNAQGKVSLIVSASGSRNRSRGSTLELVLTRSDRRMELMEREKELGEELAETVIEALKSVDKQNKLKLRKLTVDANLSVTKSASTGVEIEIYGVSISDTSFSRSRAGNNAIKLVFGTDPS